MMQTPEKRNPGWRAGALESEAGATKFPETDISLEAHRAQWPSEAKSRKC